MLRWRSPASAPAPSATLPCVVFIHGAMHDHSSWTLLARWCAHHGHGVLALNQPGRCRSAGPPLPSVEALADWTLALLAAAGVQQPAATLVGHSMGTLIALEAAARAPERVARLVLLGSAYPMKVSNALLGTAREAPLRAIDMVNALSIHTLASKPSYPGPGMWVHGSNRALMRNQPAVSSEINLFEHAVPDADRRRPAQVRHRQVGREPAASNGREATPGRVAGRVWLPETGRKRGNLLLSMV